MTRIYVALGANLDEPQQQLDNACERLMQLAESDSFSVSSYYRSKPMGDVVQPDYINAVCRFNSPLSPIDLLDALQAIEAVQGRERLVRWGARTLDLDILLFGQKIINMPRLIVPHYGMKQRSFVLVPLYELEPSLLLPCQTPLVSLIKPEMHSELEKI